MGALVDARHTALMPSVVMPAGGAADGRERRIVDPRTRWGSDAWRREIHAWIDDALVARGERVRTIVEHRTRIWSAVLRIETDAGTRWAKENHPASASETAATEIAGRVADEIVLPAIALDHAHARLLTAHATLLHEDGAAPLATRIRLAETAAALQRRLASCAGELVARGLPDLRPSRLEQTLLDRVDAAGRLPPEHPAHLDAEARAEVRSRAPRLREHAAILAASGIPSSLEHNDLHLGNAFLVDGRICIGDLGDAVVAHPFGTLRVLLGSARARGVDERDRGRIRDAYLDGWSDLADRATLTAVADAALATSGIQRWEAWWRLTRDAPVDAVAEYRRYVQPLLLRLGDLDAATDDV